MKNLGKINEGALNEIQLTDAIREEAIMVMFMVMF